MLNEITITDIKSVRRIWSYKGKTYRTKDRKTYGLSLCESGEIVYHTLSGEVVSDRNHAILLPMGSSYSLRGLADGWFPLIDFTCTDDFVCNEIVKIPLSDPDQCFSLFRQLQAQSFISGNRAGTMALFYMLLKQISKPNFQKKRPLIKAISYIEEHLSDPELSENALCEAAKVSGAWLRRLFADAYKLSPKQMILQKRLQLAQHLLAEYDYSINDTAAKCGFSDIYHFSKFFKSRTGITPSQYRRISREGQAL